MLIIRHHDLDTTCLSVLAISSTLGMPNGSSLATACQSPSRTASKHTCTSSHAPHASSPLRTHDEHFSNKNLLAISSPASITRISAASSNAILEDQLAYMASYITTTTLPSTTSTSVQSLRHVSNTVYTPACRIAMCPPTLALCGIGGAFPYRAT